MKRILLATLFALALTMSGCGSSSSSPPNVTTSILSDPSLDGDITKTAGTSVFTIAQGGTQNLFAGIDPVTLDESRAFLDFPLTGAGGVPGKAIIVAATIDVFINSRVPATGSIPMRAELVSFGSPLTSTDYDSTPLAGTVVVFPIFGSDVGNHVRIDVTPLMEQAQNLGLLNFQVRILEDFGPPPPLAGLIEINDTTGVNQGALAPLLEVTYF